MVRGSLRKEGSFILVDFHGHGRPWSLGGAAARGERWEKSVREWRLKRNDQRGGVAGQLSFIEGDGVGCLLFDWLGGVAAHLLIGVVGRQGL
jgi:hypothetical protein